MSDPAKEIRTTLPLMVGLLVTTTSQTIIGNAATTASLRIWGVWYNALTASANLTMSVGNSSGSKICISQVDVRDTFISYVFPTPWITATGTSFVAYGSTTGVTAVNVLYDTIQRL